VTRVLVVNGPNLNLLGTREPEIYGHTTLDQVNELVRAHAAELGLEIVECFQSNHEGAIIDRLQRRDFDVTIINAGGLTHTSVSLRDALTGIGRPFIEVHISDPWQRDEFRRVNFLHDVAFETIKGQGIQGYLLALDVVADRLAGRPAGQDG
jgi:3-dehydroquinate dehydratase-2